MNHDQNNNEGGGEAMRLRAEPTAPPPMALVRQLAKFAALAYQAPNVHGARGAAALVTHLGGDVVVAFRGSCSPQDFLQDGKFVRAELAWTHEGYILEVHQGFLEDIESLTEDLVREVRRTLAMLKHQINPAPNIYFTGHSLGGALAILGALECSRLRLQPELVVTFGQPRVGNAAFAACYNASLGPRTFHVVNAADPVPLLPPLLFGYRDEGNEIFLPQHSGWRLNPSLGFEIVSDVLGVFSNWRHRKLALIPNHLIRVYQKRLA